MSTWYEEAEQYARGLGVPSQLKDLAGPRGVACVPAYESGKTGKGWSESDFPRAYKLGALSSAPKERKFEQTATPFALVMRSMQVVCIDIDRHLEDGGADGFITAAALNLPPTLAETSRSGAGRHLFYRVEQEWDERSGFAPFPDMIGFVPGVDVRATGCVFHWGTQLWNDLPVADLPEHLLLKFAERQHTQSQRQQQIAATVTTGNEDDMEDLHASLELALMKPIPAGKRNNTLFAIGNDLRKAQHPRWQELIEERGAGLGLPADEVEKLVANISRQP